MSPDWADPGLSEAYAEAAAAVGEAFARALVRHGKAAPPPKFGTNPNDAISRYVEWWLDLPGRYDSLSCEMSLLDCSDGPEVDGRIALWRYLGHGFSDHDDLWCAETIVVQTPAEAANAIRAIASDLVRRCDRLDLRGEVPKLDPERA